MNITASMYEDKHVKVSVSKSFHSFLSRFIIIYMGALPHGYLMLGISAERQNFQTYSFITECVPFLRTVHSGFSSPSLRFFASGCPASTGSFVGTSGRTGASPLLVSSASLSATSV
jgi:hypothetical protein